ncbi:MAG: hypothetical protein ACK5AO_01535 [bacterium]|jgi:hypothetical protein
MNGRILELFMKENDAWDDLINRHSKEIPDLENMINAIFDKKKYVDEEVISNVNVLKNEFREQGNHMISIREALAEQQTYLADEKRREPFPVKTLMSQNALRERIRTVEKKFLDLKCNYLNYVASAL